MSNFIIILIQESYDEVSASREIKKYNQRSNFIIESLLIKESFNFQDQLRAKVFGLQSLREDTLESNQVLLDSLKRIEENQMTIIKQNRAMA